MDISSSVSNPPDGEKAEQRKAVRLLIPLILLLAGFLAVAGKLFMIQIVHGSDYEQQARRQYESRVPLAANRGDIYDRKHKLIATTMQKLSLAVDPNMVQHPQEICRLLAAITGKPASAYLEKITATTSSFVWLERAIDNAEFTPLDTLHDAGLVRVHEPRRNFAYGSVAAQVLGFTNIDNNGVSGLELAWDSLLKGSSGSMILQRDGRGNKRPSADMPVIPPKDGHSLVLTLDIEMQGIVDSELERGVREADAESGTVIVIKPSTGEILAIASYPTYNPNNPATAAPELVRNRSITDMYEPGSTFKLVTAAALLEEGMIHSTDTVDARGGVLQVKDHTIQDAHPLHRITFADALAYSSNVAFATLSDRISNDKFYKYVRDFGFGIVLGVDVPGEVRGIVKKPREFDASTKLFMAFGYELAATALQIVNAYATVANGGVMMKPYLVQKILDRENEEAHSYAPQTIRRVISKETAQQLTELLVGVVDNGTGQTARVQGLKIAGKTGTAQQLVNGKYSKQQYTASFVGFFPAEQPEIAMIVMLDKPHKGYYGGEVAAPIFRRIAQRVVSASLVMVPEAHHSIAVQQEPVRIMVKVPDVRGLAIEDARELLHQYGLRLTSLSTEGVILSQSPAPGDSLERGSEVSTQLRTPAKEMKPSLSKPARPDVRGMTIRRALNILQAAHIKAKVTGSGIVVRQQWEQAGKEEICVLECRNEK